MNAYWLLWLRVVREDLICESRLTPVSFGGSPAPRNDRQLSVTWQDPVLPALSMAGKPFPCPLD